MVAGGILPPMSLDADQISYKLPSRSINPEAFKRVANYCSPKAEECCYSTPTLSQPGPRQSGVSSGKSTRELLSGREHKSIRDSEISSPAPWKRRGERSLEQKAPASTREAA